MRGGEGGRQRGREGDREGGREGGRETEREGGREEDTFFSSFSSELTHIRQTLCGGHPLLSRGSRSLYLPGAARQRSRDLTSSLSPVPPAPAASSAAAQLTESLPPSKRHAVNFDLDLTFDPVTFRLGDADQ